MHFFNFNEQFVNEISCERLQQNEDKGLKIYSVLLTKQIANLKTECGEIFLMDLHLKIFRATGSLLYKKGTGCDSFVQHAQYISFMKHMADNVFLK